MDFLRKNSFFPITLFSGLFYYLFAYHIDRTQFSFLLLLWIVLFSSYYLLVTYTNKPVKYYLGLAILFRLIFLFAIPNLSQDFYRFIWDGRMIFEGFNPYISLPETIINSKKVPIPQAEELYKGMGSMNGSHFTNYPPVNQFCFFIAAALANKSILSTVIVMRFLIISADIGIFYFGHKMLKNLYKNPNLIFLYLLNPFIIIELTGNLHFEPVMLFFLVWALYHLQKKEWAFAAILLSFSITAKLIPLLFLPLFFKWFLIDNLGKLQWKNLKQLILFYSIVIISCIILFLPFYSEELINNYSNSIGLWFKNFEFNASFYYLLRGIGYLFRGYNEIAILGKVNLILTILFLIIITFYRKNKLIKELITSMLLTLSFYYFTTTTIHPWYLATLIILSIFTKYRFPLIWSFVIILSYQAYANNPLKENLWFVFSEYLVVYAYLIYEIKKLPNIRGKIAMKKKKGLSNRNTGI